MEYISSIKDSAIQLFGMMQWRDYVDILIVALAIYFIAVRVRSTSASRVFKPIVFIIVLGWLAEVFKLNVISWIIENALNIGLLALVVVFQPELRRTLEHFGSGNIRLLLGADGFGDDSSATIMKIVRACSELSREKVGALIVFERKMKLDDYYKTGTVLNAEISVELLKNIFFPKAALHDGAVLISDNRIAAAGCVLPLTKNSHLSKDLGTRHRAAVGMAESTDALVIVVSEESGVISAASDSMLKRYLTEESLEKLLRAELLSDESDNNRISNLKKRFKVKKNESR